MHKQNAFFARLPRTADSHRHGAKSLGSVPKPCRGAPSRERGTAQPGLTKGCKWKEHSKTFRLFRLKWNKSSLAMLNCSFSEVFNLAKFGWFLMSMTKTYIKYKRLPVLLAKLEAIWKGTFLKVLVILIWRITSLFEITCYYCKVPRTSAWSGYVAQAIPVPAVGKIMCDWKLSVWQLSNKPQHDPTVDTLLPWGKQNVAAGGGVLMERQNFLQD